MLLYNGINLTFPYVNSIISSLIVFAFSLNEYSKYLIALIDILKEVLQDKGDTISWWLWELTDNHIIEEIDGSK